MVNISEIVTKASLDGRTDTEIEILQLMDKLGIKYELVDNDVVETMEECIDLDNALGTEIRKSILLKNKKKTKFYLCVMPANKRLDTKKLGRMIGVSGLSFADEEYMVQYLAAKPGSASVMGLVNDKDRAVQLVLDKAVADSEFFGSNTGINTSHLKIKTNDLIRKFLPAIKHEPIIVEL